jgi:hypothetical protein
MAITLYEPTGIRFPPLETSLSMGVKLGLITLPGPRDQGLAAMLLNPFKSPASPAAAPAPDHTIRSRRHA